jgi:GT2 family glycosyltransferase
VPRLSILIPVLGNLNKLEDTLVSVLQSRPDDCQIVVVLDEPYGDPYALAGEVTFVSGVAGGGLADQLNVGWRWADAPIVHVLRCGAEVEPDWAEMAMPLFRDPLVASVAPLVLDRTEPDEIVSAGVEYRPNGEIPSLRRPGTPRATTALRPGRLGPEAWAAFFRRSAIDRMGGFSPEVTARLLGTEVGLWLRQMGWQTAFQPRCRVFVDRASLGRHGSFREGWETERFFWRWAPQAGWGPSLRAHARLIAAEGLGALVRPALMARLAGRLVGAVRLAAHRDHWRAIKSAPRVSATSAAGPHFFPSNEPAERVDAPVPR